MDQPTPAEQSADYVREQIAVRRRKIYSKGIHDGYSEGYDDALCWVLDLLDGTSRPRVFDNSTWGRG